MYEFLLSLIQSLVIIILYYFLSLKIIEKTKVEVSFFNILFLYHLIFCFAYIAYCYFEISDSKTTFYLSTITEFNNYNEQQIASFNLEFGQPFMILIVKYIVLPLQLTFISGTVIFGMISFTGILILYWLMRESTPDEKKIDIYLIRIFFLFPSLHFWQMSMSKDAIIFFCICLFILFLSNIKNYLYLGIVSLTIIFLLRPYLIPFFLTFTLISFILDKKIKANFKLLTFIFLPIPLFFIFQISLAYVGIDLYQLNIFEPYLLIEKINTIIGESREVAVSQNAGIDKTEMTFSYQIFIYLFGPLNIFYNGIFYKIASFENILLLSYIIFLIMHNRFYNIDTFKLVLCFIFISLLIILAFRTANYGISMRQKWMIIPFLIIFLSNVQIKLFNKKN